MKCLAWRLAHMGRSKNVSYCYFYWQTLFLLFPAIRFSPPFLFVAALMHTPLRQPLAGPSVHSLPALSSGGGVPGGSVVENRLQCRRRRRHGFSPWVGKMPWRRNGNPLQSSCLGNPMDREAWVATSPWGRKDSDTTEHACAFLWWSPLWGGSHTVALPGSRVEA